MEKVKLKLKAETDQMWRKRPNTQGLNSKISQDGCYNIQDKHQYDIFVLFCATLTVKNKIPKKEIVIKVRTSWC